MRGDLRFFDALHAKSAFLHHATHSDSDVWIAAELRDFGRALLRQWPEVFFVNVDRSRDLALADRPLVVIEEIETPHFERAVVRAIPRADAAVVGHHVEAVLAVHRRVDGTNRFARRVLA